MQETTTKEKILKRVRAALIHKTKNPYPNIDLDSNIYEGSAETPDLLFAQQLTSAGGQFIFCENELDFIENLISLAKERKWDKFLCWEKEIQAHLDSCVFPYLSDDSQLEKVKVGITSCEFLVARTGSVIISSKQASGRRLPFFSSVHIVLAYSSQLVYDVKEALAKLKNKYANDFPSMITAITGPSKTSDIEMKSITGVHGSKEIYVFLIEKPETANIS